MVTIEYLRDEESLKALEEFREYFYGRSVKLFERACKFAQSVLKVKKISKKTKESLQEAIEGAFLKVTPEEVCALSYLQLIAFLTFGMVTFLLIDPMCLILSLLLALLSYQLTTYYPKYLYQKIELKKQGQLVFVVLYLAMKLRHISNLERALEYTAKYIQPPLKFDLLKLLWDFYNKKYPSIVQALDDYAMKWEDKAFYFTIGMRLLLSSIQEPDPLRRNALIDKAVEETLDSLYEKLSFYVRELQSPIHLIYMLGIVLPTMILTLFPIMAIILSDIFNPRLLFIFFDVALPFMLLTIIKQSVEGKRVEFSTMEDKYLYLYMKKHKSKIKLTSTLAGIIVFFVTLFFLVFIVEGMIKDYTLLSVFISAVFVFSLGTSIAVANYLYYLQYKDFIRRLDKIDSEISSLLFQLSSRLYQGMPLEHAFASIYKNFRKKDIGKFILRIFRNMKVLGMSVYDAIFDRTHGALIYYPSSLLESSMEIITESSHHSLETASHSALAIARYFLYLNRTKQRMLDLLAEITAQMKTLAKIIGPLITGLVVAISIMTLNIMLKLGLALGKLKTSSFFSTTGTPYGTMYVPLDILDIFNVKGVISPGAIYIIIGIYTISVTYILAYMLNIIENGRNSIKEKQYIASYLFFAVLFYTIISLVATVFLWGLAEMLGSVLETI